MNGWYDLELRLTVTRSSLDREKAAGQDPVRRNTVCSGPLSEGSVSIASLEQLAEIDSR